MTVSLSIMRAACRFMENTPPSSLDEQTELARDLVEAYPEAMQQILEAADWSFASVLVHLPAIIPADTIAQDADLPYLYALPDDCAVLRDVGTGLDKWRRDAAGIRSNAAAPLRVRYTSKGLDESRMPAEFRKVVALAIAEMLGPVHLQTASKLETIKRDRANSLKMTMRTHARDASPQRYDDLPDQEDWLSGALR